MSIWQITLKYTQDGAAARNVLHYRGINDSDVSWPDVLQQFAVSWAGTLAGSYSPGTLFQGINVLEKVPGAVSLDYDVAGGGLPGTAVDKPNIPQASQLVTLIGALPTKPARGRIFLPSPTTEQVSPTGTFILTHRQRVEEWTQQIAQVIDTEGAELQLIIYSRVWPDGGGLLYNDVASFVVQSNAAIQRKRRYGSGI